MKNSLRLKVTASVGVVLIIVFSALLVAETRVVTKELSEKAHRNSQMIALTVEKSLRDAMTKRRQAEVAAIISSVAELPDILRIGITDGDGSIILQSPAQEHKREESDVRKMIGTAVASGSSTSKNVSGDILRTVSPIRNEKRCWSCHESRQQYLGHLLVDLSTRADRLALSRNRQTIMAGAIAGLTITALTLLIALSRLVYRPIDHLMSAMARIREGHVSARVDTSGGDELRKLSEALNAMVAGLERQNAEIVKSRERLLEARRLATVGLFAAGMAHEINNPNGAILVASEGLASYVPADSDGAKLLSLIERSSERISRLVSDLLRFDPKQPMSHMPLDVNALTRYAVNEAVDGLAGPEYTISLDLTADTQGVIGDGERLRQAITNVVVNALEAMPSGGSLTVATSSDEKYAHIVISDTGGGISEEDLPRVTDPFFTRKEDGKGRGLGLAIAREIVAQHGGELTLSAKQNEGTKVHICISKEKSGQPCQNET